MGDHRRARAGGAAALRPGVDRRAARQRARHPGGVDGRHAARAARRGAAGAGAARLRRWLVEWLLQFLEWCAALPGALWEQHVPPLWSVLAALAGAAWVLAPRGVPGARPGSRWWRRHSCSPPRALGRRGVDHRVRRRTGPRRGGAHRDPHTGLRRRAGVRRRGRQRRAHRGAGAARGGQRALDAWSSATRTPTTSAARSACSKASRSGARTPRCRRARAERARRPRRCPAGEAGTGTACASLSCTRRRDARAAQ